MGEGRRKGALARVGALVLVVCLLAGEAISLPTTAANPTGSESPIPDTGPAVLTIHGNVANESNTFWGVSMDGTETPDTSAVAALLNATPIRSLRYGALWSEEENWSNGCIYLGTSTCKGLQEDPTAFGHLCEWLGDYCILGLPAEINSPSTAVYLAKHLKAASGGWTPSCWQIGNEPVGYTHYGITWTSWASSDSSTDSAATFATTSSDYVDALRQAFAGACIIPITPGHTAVAQSWISTTLGKVTNGSAIGYHSYNSAGSCTGWSASQYLSRSNLAQLASDYVRNVAPNNTAGLPVYVSEFGTGSTACPLMASYSNAVFLSAGIAQALDLGISMVAPFRFYCGSDSCLYNSTTDRPTPSYTLYSGVLDHLEISHVYNVTVNGANPEVWAVEGSDGTNHTMLIVNANATDWLNVSESFVPAGDEIQSWAQAWPSGVTVSSVSSSPSTLTLRNQSTTVVHYYAPPGNGSSSPPAGGSVGGAGAVVAGSCSSSLLDLGCLEPELAFALFGALAFALLLATIPRRRSSRR